MDIPAARTTPLYENHMALKAQMAPFGGFNMPIQYEGILAEHKQCRESAALFDICHMGEFVFQGDAVSSGFSTLPTFPVDRIPVGKCKYGFFLNPMGGVLDDCIIYRMEESEWMVVVNSATISKDFEHIKKSITGGKFTDISDSTAKLDLQGPESRDVVLELFGDAVLGIPYFGFTRVTWEGIPVIVSRTGYTGELGYELYLSASHVVRLWDRLLTDPRVKPAGLGARDILRLEMGYSLYGSDLSDTINPLEAGLEAFIKWEHDFIGKSELLKLKDSVKRERVGFRTLSRRSPRPHYRIYADGIDIGEVTSGAFSPILGYGIGMGYVDKNKTSGLKKIVLKHETLEIEAEITALPFYKGGSIRA